jgi:osmoprotectant transport system substrate-binding protein
LSGSITIGSANFNEQELVAEMVAQLLESRGMDVTRRFKLGAREVVAPALEKGDIDAYVEYVGSYLTFLQGTPTGDLESSLADLRAKLEPKGLVALQPAPAEDKNAFVVTKETADELKLAKISDLANVPDKVTFGGPPECPERPLCLVGLQETYGLTNLEFKPLDVGGPLTVAALENGDIQMGLLFSSDGTIAAKGWVALEDDKKLQPVENLVVVGNQEKLTDDVAEVLDAALAELTTEELQALNVKLNVDKEDPAAVAKAWLQSKDLLPAS